MAKNEKTAVKYYLVKVKNNPEYCGEGAGGAQFANGEAKVTSERLASWYGEHDGYTVEPVAAEPEQTPGK